MVAKDKSQDFIPDGIERLFKKRREEKTKQVFHQRQHFILKYGMMFGLLCILVFYFCMPMSYVKNVSVEGNYNLSKDYIKSISGISTSKHYYLTIPVLTELLLKSNPMIQDAHVSLEKNHIVSIQISEKKAVGYRYTEDQPTVLLSDTSTAELKGEYLDIIADIPLITGFETKEQTNSLCSALETLDQSVIAEISEISQYDMAYDKETVKVLMRTGGYFLSSYRDLHMLNDYNLVVNKMSDPSMCAYAFSSDTGNTVYTRTCPWNENPNVEYWTDESGNVIKNEYGDQVPKHYYTDEEGKNAVDGNGNPIPIPIDEHGSEVMDTDFQEHYANGYYQSGVLTIPESSE